jgi:hypothetical protein
VIKHVLLILRNSSVIQHFLRTFKESQRDSALFTDLEEFQRCSANSD